MRYYSKVIITDKLTKLEVENYKRLRKISILKNLPFSKWKKVELIDLIKEYELYYIIDCQILRKEEPVTISKFVKTDRYEKLSLFEELKSLE